MEYKQQLCREHNGYFSIPIKRGRPPVKCSPDNVCDAISTKRKKTTRQTVVGVPNVRVQSTPKATGGRRPGRVAQATAERLEKQTGRQVKAVRGATSVATSVVVNNNPSIRWATEAKRLLEPQGWKAQGRAWSEVMELADGPRKVFFASLIASRGEETISFLWRDAKLMSQEYKMWNTDKPSENGMPRKRLDFDPDEMSDAALIKRLSGRKVIWWNTLGKSTDHAIIPHGSDKRVKVEHLLNGNGDEEARVVTFVDATNSSSATGFRSFHVNALLKVSD